MIRRLLLLMSFVILAATVAEAQPQRPTRPRVTRAGRWDFSLQTRYSWSKEFSQDNGSSVKIHDDLGWGFGFGYHLNENFNLGLGFTWRSVPYDAVAVDATDPENVVRYSNTLSTSTFGATVDWNILDRPITPYVTGSAAWMLIDTNVFAGYGTGCWWDPWWGYICGSVPYTYGIDTGAFNLGIGGRFELTESFFIRVGYEHGWISAGASEGTDLMRIDMGFTN